MGWMIGRMSALIRCVMKSLSMRSTLPVCCWSMPLRIPTGRARTELVIAHFKVFCVRPSRMRCETRDEARMARSSVAMSVTPVPSALVMAIFRDSESSTICWPMPWTRTTLMPSERSTAMSTRRLLKFSSATMEPSIASTKICPWKRGTYLRMPRRSVGLISAVLAGVAGVAGPLLIVGIGGSSSGKRAGASTASLPRLLRD